MARHTQLVVRQARKHAQKVTYLLACQNPIVPLLLLLNPEPKASAAPPVIRRSITTAERAACEPTTFRQPYDSGKCTRLVCQAFHALKEEHGSGQHSRTQGHLQGMASWTAQVLTWHGFYSNLSSDQKSVDGSNKMSAQVSRQQSVIQVGTSCTLFTHYCCVIML